MSNPYWEYGYFTPDSSLDSTLTGSVATTRELSQTPNVDYLDVTGFPANTVLQPGDVLYKGASFSTNSRVVVSRVALNGSGAGRVHSFTMTATAQTFTAADALTVKRPDPATLQSYFEKGGLIVAANTTYRTLAPTFDLYLRGQPSPDHKLYIVMDAALRGKVGQMDHQLVLKSWAGAALETWSMDGSTNGYAVDYGIEFSTDEMAACPMVFEVAAPAALTDWRYKVTFDHVGAYTGSGSTVDHFLNVFYIAGVAAYWSDAPLGAFRWSYGGALHRAWDYSNDALFERSEPLVNYRVSAKEMDPDQPYVVGAECDLRDGSTRATPKIVAVRRWLDPSSTDLPLPELELDNRTAALTRQLVARGSV